MDKNKRNICIFFIVAVGMCLYYKMSYAYKYINIFDEIIDNTRCSVEEYGVETHFTTKINGQELIEYFNNEITNNYNGNSSIIKNKDTCKIIFNYGNGGEGTLIIQNLNSSPLVKIKIFERKNYNNLYQINKWVENIESQLSEEENINYQYLKGKLPKGNLSDINNELIKLLKNKGSKNIDSIEINNGFTTCAYTNQYKPKKINGKLMDFNYALSNYSSGEYIIMGTPEIVTTY